MGYRVAVAGGRHLMRQGLQTLLEASGNVEVVATCGDLTSLLAAVENSEPDVVVTHAFLGTPKGGAEVALRLRQERPTVGVVMLLGDGDPSEVAQILDEGTQRRALLLLDHPRVASDLVAAVEEVATGGSIVHPGVVDLVMGALRRSSTDDQLGRLTPRERQVLEQMATGASNAGVALALGLSERAVEKHINQLYGKLDQPQDPAVHRRVAAVIRYLELSRGVDRKHQPGGGY